MKKAAKKKPTRYGTRSVLLTVWLEPEEREALRAAAKRDGLGVGPWVRTVALRSARAGRVPASETTEER